MEFELLDTLEDNDEQSVSSVEAEPEKTDEDLQQRVAHLESQLLLAPYLEREERPLRL
jgi:hypothetical protein